MTQSEAFPPVSLGSVALPVMVWIAAGAFEHGTGAEPMYNGTRFARDGVVCVTINYRVRADGFLYAGPGFANYGLLDQLAALTWVEENIAAFGSDPGNVTVFGESAGAMSIGTLLSMPRAKGLFQRAIAPSGAAHQVIPVATAQRVSLSLTKKLGVAATRPRGAIAAISTDRLLQAQAALTASCHIRLRIRVALETVRRAARCLPWARGRLCLRNPGVRNRARRWSQSATASCRCDARCGSGDEIRFDLAGRVRPSGLEASAFGRGALRCPRDRDFRQRS